MKKAHVKVTVDLWLESEDNTTEHDFECMGYDYIHQYLNISNDYQEEDEDRFEGENGFLVDDYLVSVASSKII